MYANEYNDKVVKEVRHLDNRVVANDERLSGGFLGALAGFLLPALLPSVLKAVGAGGAKSCSCEGEGMSGASGFGYNDNTFMDTGFPMDKAPRRIGAGYSAGVKKFNKKVKDMGCGMSGGTALGSSVQYEPHSSDPSAGYFLKDVLAPVKKGRGRPRKMKGKGIIADLAGALGLGKPKSAFDGMMESFAVAKKAVKASKKKKGGAMPCDKATMMSSSMSGMGKGDGRKKRAEIVKKVMKEKGLKMIEASKYVKEHKLY